jgi:hypothetical protein
METMKICFCSHTIHPEWWWCIGGWWFWVALLCTQHFQVSAIWGDSGLSSKLIGGKQQCGNSKAPY